ncbi:MAG: SH3 domain-containing protein [Lachnospiraceae bacterium]|nr:SH3 domain-containing protein [Lachnospiraceae bacterium]
MKKFRTLIILLFFFILTAASGKEALAGTSAGYVAGLGSANTGQDFHYDAMSNSLKWLDDETYWGEVQYLPDCESVYVWALTSNGDYGASVLEDKYFLYDWGVSDYNHYSLADLKPGKYGAAVVFSHWDKRYYARTPLIKFTIFAPGECWHLNATGGSTWSAWKTTRSATCEKDGQESRTCSQCGKTETRTIKKLGHNWGKWQTSTKATCTQQGKETRKCSRCGKTETRSAGAALGHNWSAWKVTKKASCSSEGQETRKCSRCDKTETRTVAKLPHKWGSWELSVAPNHGQPGTEIRICTVCDEDESREIPPEAPDAKVGDTGIKVTIAQELLKFGGEYKGACDGIFREDLAEAIKVFEKASVLAETGAIYPDTLSLLAERFWKGLDEEIPSGECTVYVFQESGMDVDALRKCTYTSNGDGTHKVDPAVIGFDFSTKTESVHGIRFPYDAEYPQASYNEPCRTVNAEMTCDCCGYKEELQFAIAELKDFSEIFDGGMVLYIGFLDDLEKSGLPLVDGLCYEVWNSLTWYGFSGAKTYDVWLVKLGDDDSETLLLEDHTENSFFDLPQLEPGKYGAAVQAKDKDGKVISDPTLLYFGVQSDTMPAPQNVVLKNGVVTWDYGFEYTNPVFHVALLLANEGEDIYYETDTADTWLDLTAVFMEMVAKGVNPQGIQVEIAARDANGVFKDSEQAYCASEKWMIPSFYRVLCAVNVRSGPGKNYERIGGYSRGDYFITYETEFGADGIYYVVNYKGQTGYVLSSCAAWFIPKLFTAHVDMGDGKSAEVFTNPDGTIDQTDLENKVQKKGWRLTALKQTGGSGTGELDLNRVLSPGDTFEAVWEKDPDYVFVRFCKNAQGESARVYGPDGKLTDKEIPIRIGSTFRIQTGGGDAYVPGWRCWDGDYYMEVTDETPFTAKMTTVFMYERKGQEITLGKQTLTGRREELLYLYDVNNKPLGRLQEGDVLTITDCDNRIGNFAKMYKVGVKRLGKEGFIFAELLDGQNGAKSWNIYFDPDGGYCPVAWLKATYQKGYPYPTLTRYPAATRSGYYFAGWTDKTGNVVTPGYEFTDSVKLKANWIKYTGQEVKQGLTISLGAVPFEEQTKPYGFETPGSTKQIPLPVCEEVQVIGQTREMYQCLRSDHTIVWVEKRFIETDFEVIFNTARIGRWKFSLEGGDPDDEYMDDDAVYAYLGDVYYKGQLGTLFYVIGRRGGKWQKVAVPNAIRNKDVSLGAGVGWVCNSWMAYSTYGRVNFCAGEGICWLDSVDVKLGSSIASQGGAFPIPCLSGYEFDGWYTDPVLGKWFDANTPVTESLTVYAHYRYLYDDYQAATEDAPIFDRCSSSEGEVLGYVKAGETVAVQKESKKGLFAWVTHDGVSGWVQTRYLVAGNIMEAKGERKEDMAIRSKAQYKKGTVYRNVKQVELFLVIGSEGSYYKVSYPCEAGYAYIAKDQLQKR